MDAKAACCPNCTCSTCKCSCPYCALIDLTGRLVNAGCCADEAAKTAASFVSMMCCQQPCPAPAP